MDYYSPNNESIIVVNNCGETWLFDTLLLIGAIIWKPIFLRSDIYYSMGVILAQETKKDLYLKVANKRG